MAAAGKSEAFQPLRPVSWILRCHVCGRYSSGHGAPPKVALPFVCELCSDAEDLF